MTETRKSEQSPDITPEMIEAGVEAFHFGDTRFESEEDIVVRIFQAMTAKANWGSDPLRT